MGWLYRYSIRRPWQVIVAATVISLAVMPGPLRLKMRTDDHTLVPPRSPGIRIDMRWTITWNSIDKHIGTNTTYTRG